MMSEEQKRIDDRIVRFFAKHLVPVFFRFEKASEEPQTGVITAFVLSVANRWFLVTASHCIRDIELLIDRGYELKECSLIDSIGLDVRYFHPIPFNYQNSQHHRIDVTENLNFDYAAIPITPYFRDVLEKNNIEALDEEAWKLQPPKADFYALLGVPEELVEVDSKYLSTVPVLYFVEPLDKPPKEYQDVDTPLFHGHIKLAPGMTTIKGTSGGPIFAFLDQGGQLRYWLTALQSTWDKPSQNIVACYIKPFGSFLEKLVLDDSN